MEWAEIKSLISLLHEVHTGIRQRDTSALSDPEAQRMQRQIEEVHRVIHALERELRRAKSGEKKEMLSHLLQETHECRVQLLDQFAGCLGYDWLFAD